MTFLDLLELPFMRFAVAGGLLLAPLAGLLGTFVVLRGFSFFGEAIAHSTLAGIAIAVLLGFAPGTDTAAVLGILLVYALLVALAIHWMSKRGVLRSDVGIAIIFSTSIALGNLLIYATDHPNPETLLMNVVFGSLLFLDWADLVALAVLLAVVIGFLAAYRSELTLVTLHPEYATAVGVRVDRINLMFLMLLTLTVAMGVRLLGAFLVTAVLVIPAAGARHLASSLSGMLAVACGLALVAIQGGIVVSAQVNMPTGPTVVLLCTGLFLACVAWSRWVMGRQSPQSASSEPGEAVGA